MAKRQEAMSDSAMIYADLDDLRRLQYKAKGFSFLPTQPVNSLLSGKHVSKLRGRGLNFEELRHYRPGDDIRSMDWKATRRTGKPHIKVYTEERERNVYLAIDQRASMFFGSTQKMKSVAAAQLAALVAWRISDTGDRVGAVIYGDNDVKIIPAKRGKQHVVSLLTAIVEKNQQLNINATSNNTSEALNNALAKVNSVARTNALVILLSDGHGWNEKSTAHVKRLRQHNEFIACHIFDPLELQIPEMSQMVVSDGVQQIQFSSKDKAIRRAYEDEITAIKNQYSLFARKYRIPLLPIDTVEPVERQLRHLLGVR